MIHVGCGTYVNGAGIESGDPQFLIGYAVSAHDGQRGKIVMQVADVGQARTFHIEDYGLRLVAGHALAKLIAGAGQIGEMKVRGEIADHRSSEFRIALDNNYT
jgi:hypothetical protein